jgi:hypothetical protein
MHEVATQFQNWVVNRSQKWGAPILETPEDRRDKFLDADFTVLWLYFCESPVARSCR